VPASHEAGGPASRRVAGAVAGCVGAAALLAGYVASHPELLRLGDAVVGFGSAGAGDGPGLVHALASAVAGIAAAAAILAAALGFGRIVFHAVLGPIGLGLVLDWCASLVAGAGILALLTFACGHAGLLTRPAAWSLVAAGCLALVAVEVSRRHADGPPEEAPGGGTRLPPVAWIATGGMALAALLALVVALAPPTARDALAYHLAAPKAYIAANAIVELPWSVHSYLPFATEMLFTLGLLTGPETTPNLLHLCFGVACAALVASLTWRLTGSPLWTALAALSFAAAPSVIWNAGIAHNEMWMTLAVSVAAIALGRWWETRAPRLLVWAAVGVGVALAAKHTALLLVPIVGVVVLVRLRSESGAGQVRALAAASVAALAGLVVPLPWYVQNAVRTGNPVYPYFWNVFPTHSPVWDGHRAEVFEAYLRLSYGQGPGVLAWLTLPFDVSIRAQNDVIALFDGVIGPAFLCLGIVAASGLARSGAPAWLRVAGAVAGANAVVWSTQSQQLRFLLPILPIVTVAGVWSLSILTSGRSGARALATAAVALLGGTAAVNLAIAAVEIGSVSPAAAILGRESRESYLRRKLAYFELYERLNRELGPDGRVLLVNMRNDGYLLDVPFVSDSVLEDYTVGRIVNEAASVGEVRDGIRRLGATHILVREDILLDHRYTPFVDRASRSRWTGFLAAHARRMAGKDGMALYALDP